MEEAILEKKKKKDTIEDVEKEGTIKLFFFFLRNKRMCLGNRERKSKIIIIISFLEKKCTYSMPNNYFLTNNMPIN